MKTALERGIENQNGAIGMLEMATKTEGSKVAKDFRSHLEKNLRETVAEAVKEELKALLSLRHEDEIHDGFEYVSADDIRYRLNELTNPTTEE